MRTIGEVTAGVLTWNPSKSDESGSFTYIDLGAVENDHKAIATPTVVLSATAPSRARQIVATGDVLVSTVRPNLNAVAIVTPELDGATASTGFTVLRPNEHVDGRYLFHWVRSKTFIGDMVSKATGASYPAVSDRIVKESTLPLPPLDEQRRIAAILDQADSLRAKRRQALDGLGGLTQSIFNDMFGSDEWDSTLAELAAVQTGPFGSLLHQEDYITGGVAVINPMHIRDGQLLPDPEFSVSEAKAGSLSPYRLRCGDLVLGRRGEMGRAGVASAEHEGMLCGTGSLILRPREVDSWFLHAVVTSPRMKDHLERNALGATLPNLNSGIVRASPAPRGHANLQALFATKLVSVSRAEVAAQTGLEFFEELFACLQSRAFRGAVTNASSLRM